MNARKGVTRSRVAALLCGAALLSGGPALGLEVENFRLGCGSTVIEGGTVTCTLRHTGTTASAWPAVAILHRSWDAHRALVRGRIDVTFGAVSPAVEPEGALWWVGQNLIGHSRIDWPGEAAPGDVRSIALVAVDDEAYEPTETFHVTLMPDGSRDETALHHDTEALPIAVLDNDTPDSDATLGLLQVRHAGTRDAFAARVTGARYAVEVPYEVTDVVVEPVPASDLATVTVGTDVVPPGGASHAVHLAVGRTDIAVSVTAADGVTSRDYVVSVTRAGEPDAGTVTVEAEPFSLTCPSTVREGTSMDCTLTNGDPSPANAPVVAILHGSADTNRAIVAEDSVLPSTHPSYSKDVELSASAKAEGKVRYGYGEMFSGGSASRIAVYGYERVDRSGKVGEEAVTLSISVLADEAEEPDEVFYVALAPNGYAGLLDLVANRVPVVVREADRAPGPVRLSVVAVRDAQAPSSGSARLSWTAPDVGAEGIEKYQFRVTRVGETDDGPWQDVPGGDEAWSHVVGGLEDDEAYVFQMRAVSGEENGEESETVRLDFAREYAPASNAVLAALTLHGVDFGVFSAATTAYAATVPHRTRTTTVQARAADANAVVIIGPTDADGETEGHQVALAEGANEIAVTVTAEDGTTRRTYTVSATREPPPVPEVTLWAGAPPVSEGAVATFEVSLDEAPVTALTVTLTVAESGAMLSQAPTSTLTVGVGETLAVLDVPTTDDRVSETASTVTVALVAGTGYELGATTTAAVTVEDNDVAEFAVTAAPASIVEGNTATVTVTVTNGVTFAEDQTLSLIVSGVSPEDYATPAPAALVAGESAVTATFAALSDGLEEGSETALIEAALAGIVAGSVQVTVSDPPPPVATLSAAASTVPEGAPAVFEVTLEPAPVVPLTVSVLVTQEGAVLSDAAPSSVTVEAASTGAALALATDDDRVDEADGVVTATLAAGSGYELGTVVSATVTVEDDDEPDFEVTAQPSEIEEGEAATVTVSVTNGVTYAEDKTVSLTVTGVSAADYTLTPTSAVLASGESAVTATLTATADGVAEEAETARVEATLDGAVVGSVSVTVTDPPAPPLPVIEGVVQVGATLKAVFEQAESPDVAYQWLRDGEEIAGATGLSYAPTVSDVGRTVFVRVERRGVSRTSAPTGLVWAAPSNPPLAGGEEELLGTVLTLEAAEGLLLDIAGFGHFWDERFGSLTRGDFDVGDTRYTVTAAAVNNQGRFVLGTSPHLTGTEGLAVYWNGHRMGSFEETTLVGERYWETAVTQPKHEYKRYWNGASDGVRVALSIRRTAPLPTASIAADAATVGEGAAAAYTVTVDEAPRTDLAVSVSVTDEAAVLVSAAPSTVTVAAGAMSATLTLATDDDTVDEADGTVTVDLVSGAGYDLGAATSATVSVTDDDVATFAVTAEPVEIVEGGTSTVAVSVTNGVTFAADVGIDLAVTGVSASDYELAPAEASLPAGETRVTATLTAVADEEEEGSETATVTARVDGDAVGSAAVTVRDASEDASLAALALSDVDIGAFDAEVTAYTAEVPHGIGTTTVQATPTDANASVEITDAVGSTLGTERTSTLAEGANEIAAQVTAEDRATSRTYAVSVTREAAPPAWGARLPGRDIALADASAPSGVWSDGETVWVTDRYEVVRAYALSDGGRLPDRDLDVGSDSIQTALWSDGETLWVGDYYGGVLAHRLSDGARLASRDLDLETLTEAGNDRPTGLWSDGETLWVADNEDAHVYAYGVSGGARAEGQEFGLRKGDVKTGWPWGVWSDGDTALVSWYRRGKVYAYRLSGGARYGERDIDTGGSGNADPQGLWSDGETLWVVDGADRKLYAYAVPGLRRVGGVLPDLVLTNRAAGVPGADPGAPVSIPDAGLRGRIGVALGKAPEELIGANELAALTVLDARDAGVRDLTGLEHAVRLTGLDLGLNPVGDVRALASLPALATLNLDGTLVEPWSLAGLTGLERLSLRDNGIEDLSPLSGLEKLTTLDLRDNAIEDASPLAALGALVEVDLRGNRIADFSALDGNRGLHVIGAERSGRDAPQ